MTGLKTFNYDGQLSAPEEIEFDSTDLKLSAGASNTDSGLVSHNLGSNHGDGFTLGRIDLSGHDTATRFVLGQAEFA